jgi:mannose-6-phosphate isomerase
VIDPGVRKRAEQLVKQHGLTVGKVDDKRPWGGEFLFGNDQLKDFAKAFMPGFILAKYGGRLTQPKFLFLAPGKRFSWQYHHRRGELWTVVEGPVGVLLSQTDEQPPVKQLQTGDIVELMPLTRHRLTGLENWSIVAELWLHTNTAKPSDEADLVRVEDDYGRR